MVVAHADKLGDRSEVNDAFICAVAFKETHH